MRLADRVLRLEGGRVVYDGSPEQAFGAEQSDDGIRFVGEHIDGPDAEGRSRVLIDGRVLRVRYRPAARLPVAGEAILLKAEEVHAVPRSDPAVSVI